MSKRKKQFKWFSIAQYEKEQEYLSEMHKNGWKLTRIGAPGWYYFEKCEPEDVVYQLDYNQDGVANKEEYTQLFQECGWEYLFDYVGYSYFRKRRDDKETENAIFCDDTSRLDMMGRVLKGKLLPLLIIFFAIIMPQLSMQMNRHTKGFDSVILITYVALFFVYVTIFAGFAWQYFQYELKVLDQQKETKMKLYGILFALVILSVIVGVGAFHSLQEPASVYSFSKHEKGCTVSAEYLNELVEEKFELEEGTVIGVEVKCYEGEFSIAIRCEGKEPIFTGTGTLADEFEVTVPESGCYTISCEGIEAEGSVEFVLRNGVND